MRNPLGSQHIMSQTTKRLALESTHMRVTAAAALGFDWQADINCLMAKPKKPEGQYLLANQSWGLSNQPEGKDSPTTATLNVNTTYLPSSLAGNWMDVGLKRESSQWIACSVTDCTDNSLQHLSLVTPYINLPLEAHSLSPLLTDTHRFCKLQISHQILLTDCGKEMSGLISESLLQPF